MRLFTHTIHIARPRETVFDYFVDFSQASRWRSFVRTMSLVGPGPVRAGSTVHCVMDLAGGEYAFDLEVLACERPSLWRHRTDETDFNGFIEYRFAHDGDGTRVTMSAQVRPTSLYGWLAIPQLMLVRGKMYRDQLPQLRRALEDQPGVSSSGSSDPAPRSPAGPAASQSPSSRRR